VSLAIVVFECEDGRELASLHVEVKPHGMFAHWPKGSPYHCVDGEHAERNGMRVADALTAVLALVRVHGVQALVAHNKAFDRKALSFVEAEGAAGPRDALLAIPWECTLAMSRAIAPHKAGHRLAKVYARVVGTAHKPKWHDALEDSRAAKDVYCGLLELWRPIVAAVQVDAASGSVGVTMCVLPLPGRLVCGAPTKAGGKCKIYPGHAKRQLFLILI
jgi:hypothetical protein